MPNVTARVPVPVLGHLDLDLSEIRCETFTYSKRDAQLRIDRRVFHLAARALSADVHFHWRWSSGLLSGSGDGALELRNGVLDSLFAVRSEGGVVLEQIHAALLFDDITIRVSGALSWLYDALLKVFHEQVAGEINTRMNTALTHDVPKAVNAYLADIPSQVIIQGLPFWAAFRYAVYTHDYIMVSAFPQFVDHAPRAAALQATRNEAGAAPAPRECPASSTPLAISDSAVLSDGHMFTVFLNDAILQCVLWALWENEALVADIADGDLPQVRLITDVFQVLIPGINTDFPHARMRLRVRAGAQPTVRFVEGRGVAVAAQYETWVVVIGAGAVAADGAPTDLTVAHLNATVSATADVGFDATRVSDLHVAYSVVESRYKVNTIMWEATVKYLVEQGEAAWGLKALYEQFVASAVASKLHLRHAEAHFIERGWYAVSADVDVDREWLGAPRAAAVDPVL